VAKLFNFALERVDLPSKLGAIGALAVGAIGAVAAAEGDKAGKG
jgi:hypothetical protein